jgi:hypothetical protein
MSAMLSIESDRVVVNLGESLDFDVWQVLRDARKSAEAAHLPLCINIEHCQKGDMAGIGSILLAQSKLSSIKLTGCHGLFFKCFHYFGICDQCSEETGSPNGCSKRRTDCAV